MRAADIPSMSNPTAMNSQNSRGKSSKGEKLAMRFFEPR